MAITKLFIAPRLPGQSDIHLIGSFFGVSDAGRTLFTNKIPRNFRYTEFTFTDQIKDCDYVLVPHAVKNKSPDMQAYMEKVKAFARTHHKKTIVFVGGDLSHDIFISDAIVFKGSQYRYLKRDNEVIVPPFAEDLSEVRPLGIRNKNPKPVVSFCGWAGFSSPLAFTKYVLKNVYIDCKALLASNPFLRAHKKGVYYRRKAMAVLRRTKDIETKFIIRKSFSGSEKTISLDPKQAREEYVDNMYNSDFVLAPKGDANFSVRFYEALSLGRIPLLIDTETVLPLEEMIDYDAFCIRVPFSKISSLGRKLKTTYEKMSDEEFRGMQRAARDTFIRNLRYDAFFNTLFRRMREGKMSIR